MQRQRTTFLFERNDQAVQACADALYFVPHFFEPLYVGSIHEPSE
jgi:hypothetical protein